MKNIPKLFLALSSIILTSLFCYWIAEHFFFDKFFYQRSIKFGYLVSPNPDLSIYGERANDIVGLIKSMKGQDGNLKSNGETFNVAVIGDSYVWGQGIKNSDRFIPHLEEKLNKIRKTKVYSFGFEGDNLEENYEKIKFLESKNSPVKIDLYILFVVYDDLNINQKKYYPTTFADNFKNECLKLGGFNINGGFTTKSNFCFAEKVVSDLPKNLIVYEPAYFKDTGLDIHMRFKNLFESKDFTYLTPMNFPQILSDFKNSNDKLQVSKMEEHPSALANKIYAETLYNAVAAYPAFKK